MLEHGTFELDFEGCVEVCWEGSMDLEKAEGRMACALLTRVLCELILGCGGF